MYIPLVMDVQNVIREHHIYKCVWAPVISEEFSVFPEENNIHDHHAVSVMKWFAMFPVSYPEYSTTS